MTTRIELLTPALWPAFEDLFGRQGACFGCWCTYFRLPPAARRASTPERNREIILARVSAGPPPGLLALDDTRAVGWMQIGPRADVPEWNNAGRVSAPPDPAEAADPAVWAISCFFVRRAVRGHGITHALVAAGIDFARRNGARSLDSCPIRLSKDGRGTGMFVGSARVFDRAGFATLIERKPGRPLMRRAL
jgi:predicted GNAT family acetyltransferase